MRILHTADWHLGKLFYGGYLTEEQAYVLEHQFLPMVREEGIDAVVLAGDVYDRSLPPAEAVELFDEIVTKIVREYGIPFFIISGNHDSSARLSFGSRLLAGEGLHVFGDLGKLSGPVLTEDAFGPVAMVPLPFAEPAVVRHFFQDAQVTDHETALQRLIAYQTRGIAPGMRSVCIAHAFLAGSVECESERPLSIGGTEVVRASLFEPFTYTALGHLHGPQQVGNPVIRYAGSLLKYSFGEEKQKKGAVLVDMDKEGSVKTTYMPFAPRHDVRIVRGFFDEIMAGTDDRADDFILVRLDDTEPILDGMARIRKKYPHALALETPNRQYMAKTEDAVPVQGLSEQDIFAHFASAMRPGQPVSPEEQNCLNELWNQLDAHEGERIL